MANMQDGIKDPPADWPEKRQWPHDLVTMVTMVLEKGLVPERTTAARRTCLSGRKRVETKSDLPFPGMEHPEASGVSHSDVMQHLSAGVVAPVPEVPDTAPWTPVPVKTEPGVFSSLACGSNDVIIDVDAASPSPVQPKRRRIHGKRSADEDGDDFPEVGQADHED